MNILEHVKTKPTIDRSNINAGFNEYIWEFENNEYPIWCLFYKEILGDVKPTVYIHVCQ